MRAPVVRIAVLGVLAILVLPGGVAQDPSAPAASPPLDLHLLGTDAAWNLESFGDHARSTLTALGEPATLRMDVSGTPIFSFEIVAIHGARLVASVDDVDVRTIDSPSVVELPLAEGAHTLTLTARPTGADPKATLDLWGARTLTPPKLIQIPTWLYGCVLPTLDIVLDSVVPLEGFSAKVDGAPANGTLDAHAVGPIVRSTLHVTLPPHAPTDRFVPAAVELTVRDATHRVWALVMPNVGLMVIDDLGATPSTWAYALRPEIALTTSFCPPSNIASVRFTLDGVDHTRDLAPSGPRGLPVFRFTEDLPFEDAHTFHFDVTLVDGARIRVGSAFQEGLDTLDRDMGPGMLVFAITAQAATYTAKDILGSRVPIQSTVAGLPLTSAALALPAGAHLRALYAPHALRCLAVPVTAPCSPYGGNAPGFIGRTMLAATLTVTEPDGATTTIAGAGQFAAAQQN